MEKIVISVLGFDRPGIVAAVAKVLFEHHCNIEDVSQTILQTEFAGIFIATVPEGTDVSSLRESLQERLTPLELLATVKAVQAPENWSTPQSDPFVITTLGPDRLGLVAGITEVLAGFGVNITNLKAVFRGEDAPRRNIMIYEVEIPVSIDQHAFRTALHERAKELGLDLSLQHRDVFEAIHRI